MAAYCAGAEVESAQWIRTGVTLKTLALMRVISATGTKPILPSRKVLWLYRVLTGALIIAPYPQMTTCIVKLSRTLTRPYPPLWTSDVRKDGSRFLHAGAGGSEA